MKLRNSFMALSALALAAAVTPASAGTITYVSQAAGSSDSGTCPITAPCLTLTYALNQTPSSGILTIIGSGIYEPITVAQFVTITAESGVNAYIYATGTSPAVTVNNSTAQDFKLLNVNVIAASGSNSTVGIQINSARRVELSGESIRGFANNAIYIAPSSGTIDVVMRELTMSGNNSHCLYIRPTGSGAVRFLLRNSRIDHCGAAGVRADATGTAGVAGSSVVNGSVIDSVIFGISAGGITAVSGVSDATNGNVSIQLKDTTIQNATSGVVTNGTNAFLHLKNTSVFNTSTAVTSSNSTVFTYGDSLINANGSAGTPTVQIQAR